MGNQTRGCNLGSIESQLLDQLLNGLQPPPVSKSKPCRISIFGWHRFRKQISNGTKKSESTFSSSDFFFLHIVLQDFLAPSTYSFRSGTGGNFSAILKVQISLAASKSCFLSISFLTNSVTCKTELRDHQTVQETFQKKNCTQWANALTKEIIFKTEKK